MEETTFPYIRKEGIYFVVGARNDQQNQILLSKREIKILKNKLNKMDIDKFFWKNTL